VIRLGVIEALLRFYYLADERPDRVVSTGFASLFWTTTAGAVIAIPLAGPISEALLDEPDASCIQVMNFRGKRLKGECRVTEAFAPHTRVVRIQPPLTRTALRRERLVETDTGTQLTLELDYETRGGPFGALLNVALTRPRLAMVLAESLRNLKRLAESEL